MTQRLLETFGYRVWRAESAHKALEIWRHHASEVNLLLTDILMPGNLTGHELAERLHQENPRLKIIFMSGYSDGIGGSDSDLAAGMGACFLPKPCDSRTILETIRRCLDNHTPSMPGKQRNPCCKAPVRTPAL